MKNVLIYTGPAKKFDKEHEILSRIQVDNSYDLGWKKGDIILATDFPYEYNGVKSVVLPDRLFYDFDKNANKAIVVRYLCTERVIDEHELYWCHDFDAYEMNKIEEKELGLDAYDLGLTHYTYKPEWQFGSFFFKKSAADIIRLIDDTIHAKPHLSRNNEKTLTKLIKKKEIQESRYKRLDVTYNIMVRCLQTMYEKAEKPIKVLHFRPSHKDVLMSDTALDIFMYGKNRLKMPLMTKRLVDIFHYHGIK
jgi:hypothetical protein